MRRNGIIWSHFHANEAPSPGQVSSSRADPFRAKSALLKKSCEAEAALAGESAKSREFQILSDLSITVPPNVQPRYRRDHEHTQPIRECKARSYPISFRSRAMLRMTETASTAKYFPTSIQHISYERRSEKRKLFSPTRAQKPRIQRPCTF